MSLKAVFRRAARAEFDGAALWYELKIRCVLARRFPYSIFYRVEARRIVVLAVCHVRRDPTTRQSRT